MIPGPVSGHVPVDPGAAQRQQADSAGDSGADSGTSFADLLAAMLAPGAPAPQPEAAAAADQTVFDRLDAAEMFNETGLFRGAAPLPSSGAIPADLAVAASVSEAPPAAPLPGAEAELQPAPAGVGPAEAPPAFASSADGRSAPAPAGASGPAAKAANGVRPTLHGPPAALSANLARAASAEPEAAPGGRVSARTAAMVAQLLAARAGAAAAQVGVQALEGGISVMARVDRLSREERDRLRSEIGELLARHGYSNANIVLNGEAWPLPQGKED